MPISKTERIEAVRATLDKLTTTATDLITTYGRERLAIEQDGTLDEETRRTKLAQTRQRYERDKRQLLTKHGDATWELTQTLRSGGAAAATATAREKALEALHTQFTADPQSALDHALQIVATGTAAQRQALSVDGLAALRTALKATGYSEQAINTTFKHVEDGLARVLDQTPDEERTTESFYTETIPRVFRDTEQLIANGRLADGVLVIPSPPGSEDGMTMISFTAEGEETT